MIIRSKLQPRRANRAFDALKILVSGSVHLDLLSTITGHSETLDKTGDLSIEIGGTAYNVAMNLVALGCPAVVFHTAMKPSPLSRVILDDLQATRVEVAVVYDDQLPQSGFSAHLLDGELLSAVSSVSVEHHVVQISAQLRAAFQDAAFAVFDCNHSAQSLRTLMAAAQTSKVPVALCGVSEGKACRIAELPPPDLMFLNQAEFSYLKQQHPSWCIDAKTTVVVTNGADGATAVTSTQELCRVVAFPAEHAIENCLGAGDAFCAGVIFAKSRWNCSFETAMMYGARLATKVISSRNCNAAHADSFNRHLHDLQVRAERDALTGLYTRRPGRSMLADQLQKAELFQSVVSVLFVDLDFFKRINDDFGHSVGDAALKSAADAIQKSLRDESDAAIRWGGEEFVVILPDCQAESAVRVAERISAAIRASRVSGLPRQLTASFGVSTYRKLDSVDSLLQRADSALYRAKANGRNRVEVEDSLPRGA